MRISDHLKIENIFLYRSFQDKSEFYEKVVEEFTKKRIIELKDIIFIRRLFVKRENLQSTAIGNGVATPHIYSDKFKKFDVLISYIKEGMEFEAPDRQPIYLVFKIVSNERHVDKHLKTLQQIARIANTEEFLIRLRGCRTRRDILTLIRRRENDLMKKPDH